MPLHNWFMREKKAKLPPYRWGDWSSDCTHSITYAVLPVAVLHLHARFSGDSKKSFLVVLVIYEPNISLRSLTGPKHFCPNTVIFHVKWPHFYLASELLNVFSHFLHKQRPVAQHLDKENSIFKMWTNTKIPSGKSTFCDLELFPTIDQAVPVDPGKSWWRISHCAAWQGHRLWEKVSF